MCHPPAFIVIALAIEEHFPSCYDANILNKLIPESKLSLWLISQEDRSSLVKRFTGCSGFPGSETLEQSDLFYTCDMHWIISSLSAVTCQEARAKADGDQKTLSTRYSWQCLYFLINNKIYLSTNLKFNIVWTSNNITSKNTSLDTVYVHSHLIKWLCYTQMFYLCRMKN